MGLFDYRKTMSQNTADKEKAAEKSEVTKEAVVSEPAEDFVEDSLGPVVLRQVPMDFIKTSLKDGFLKLELHDDKSESGKGMLYIPSECVIQSYDNNRTVLPGMRDINIPSDLQNNLVYTVVKNGKLERQPIEIRRVQELLENQSVNIKQMKHAALMETVIQQDHGPASEYKDI